MKTVIDVIETALKQGLKNQAVAGGHLFTYKGKDYNTQLGGYFYLRALAEAVALHLVNEQFLIVPTDQQTKGKTEMATEDILNERQKTHGEFKTAAAIMQSLKEVMRRQPSYNGLSAAHREALEMIQHKVARILNGNANHKDHWDDIAGYATLAAREIPVAPPTVKGNDNELFS